MVNFQDIIVYGVSGAVLGFLGWQTFLWLRNIKIKANVPEKVIEGCRNKKYLDQELKKEIYNYPFINEKVKLKSWVKENKFKTAVISIILLLIILGVFF